MLLAWRMARTCGVSPTLPAAGTSKKRRKPYVAHMSGAGSAAMIYLQNNVFDEALERLRMIFDGHDDVIVSMSGGKDSTVLFRMALMVAQERGRLPLKVFWLDQEAEWQATVDYMQHIMELPEVTPYWYQIPFEFTNTLSPEKNFISVWNPEDKAIWIHPQHPLSIKENPSSENRFHELVNVLPSYCTDSENCAVLVGMRMTESLNRRVAITQHEARYKGVTWCKKKVGRCQVFWPIYDFTNDDIWTAISKNHWAYNRVYDLQYQWGLAKEAMRVSALIHETAWHSIEMLQEFEPDTYNKFIRRVSGVGTFAHTFDSGDIIPRQLPFAFKSWQEYRDYLLVNIVKPEYHELFRNRWKNQTGDEWYRVHVKEIVLNDIDGTNNANARSRFRIREKAPTYRKRDAAQFEQYMGSKK